MRSRDRENLSFSAQEILKGWKCFELKSKIMIYSLPAQEIEQGWSIFERLRAQKISVVKQTEHAKELSSTVYCCNVFLTQETGKESNFSTQETYNDNSFFNSRNR